MLVKVERAARKKAENVGGGGNRGKKLPVGGKGEDTAIQRH